MEDASHVVLRCLDMYFAVKCIYRSAIWNIQKAKKIYIDILFHCGIQIYYLLKLYKEFVSFVLNFFFSFFFFFLLNSHFFH